MGLVRVTTLTINHVAMLLQVARDGPSVGSSKRQSCSRSSLPGDHAFVPLALYNAIRVHYGSDRLSHVLALELVPRLDLWREALDAIAGSPPDTLEDEMASFVYRFSIIVVDNIAVETKSGAQRRSELARVGKYIGNGHFHGTNECLSDNILLTFIAVEIFPTHLVDGSHASTERRRTACHALRRHLCQHEDVRLHPTQRTCTGARATDASDHDHARAFLQSDIHGAEIIYSF